MATAEYQNRWFVAHLKLVGVLRTPSTVARAIPIVAAVGLVVVGVFLRSQSVDALAWSISQTASSAHDAHSWAFAAQCAPALLLWMAAMLRPRARVVMWLMGALATVWFAAFVGALAWLPSRVHSGSGEARWQAPALGVPDVLWAQPIADGLVAGVFAFLALSLLCALAALRPLSRRESRGSWYALVAVGPLALASLVAAVCAG